MSLRILFLDHGTKPVGGGQINTLSLVRGLDRSRFTPLVLSAQENAFTEAARAGGVAVTIMPLPVALTRLGRDSVRYDPIHLALYGWHVGRAALRLSRLVRQERIDVLHPCDNLMRILSAAVAIRTRKPVVCPIMEEFTPGLTSRLLRRLIMATMSYVLPVSERAAAFFRATTAGKARVVVTYTGIELDQFTDPVAEAGRRERRARYGEALVVGIVGRLVPIKGHRQLLEALALLKRAGGTPFHCLIVGDGPEREALGAVVSELRLDDRVSFIGFQSDIAGIMSRMDVVAAPSLTEASSRVVLEAGALGVPSVATRVGGIPEMVVDGVTGILVDAGDTQALARALTTLADASVRERMGDQARRRVREMFANDVITRKVESVYLSAAGGR